jgi:signal transduction protein with GAF and PtsI domain
MDHNLYLTTSMQEAAFLIALGHPPLSMQSTPASPIKIFVFPEDCAQLAQAYYRDAELPARKYQAAYQEVRRLLRGDNT